MGGHGQGLRPMRVTGQLLLQLVADRSVTHNPAYTTHVFTEKSLQNMRTGLHYGRFKVFASDISLAFASHVANVLCFGMHLANVLQMNSLQYAEPINCQFASRIRNQDCGFFFQKITVQFSSGRWDSNPQPCCCRLAPSNLCAILLLTGICL